MDLARRLPHLLALLSMGCGNDSPPKLPRSGTPLATRDWRSVLVGQWRVYFYVDSARSRKDGVPSPLAAASREPVVGALRVSGTLPNAGGIEILSESSIDFRSVLGREIACGDWQRGSIGLTERNDSIEIAFTPDVADCGFVATAIRINDSLTGSWYEASFGGPVVLGRFRMIRVK
jgi:hypothetical protein